MFQECRNRLWPFGPKLFAHWPLDGASAGGNFIWGGNNTQRITTSFKARSVVVRIFSGCNRGRLIQIGPNRESASVLALRFVLLGTTPLSPGWLGCVRFLRVAIFSTHLNVSEDILKPRRILMDPVKTPSSAFPSKNWTPITLDFQFGFCELQEEALSAKDSESGHSTIVFVTFLLSRNGSG